MSLRILHVLESCAPGGIETTFLNVLRAWRTEDRWATHHVLALAGGALEPAFSEAADSLTLTCAQDELERHVAGDYDVIHFLFERAAYRLLPHAVAHGRAAVVYGKGYDMGGMFRLNDGLAWQPDESMLWASDAVTFTTASLAAGFNLPRERATVLGKAADIRRFLALEPPDDSTPPRIVCVANLHARKRLGDLLAAVVRIQPRVPGLRVRFVGADDGREAARLLAFAQLAGLEHACELVGRHDDVAPDLDESLVFALPSGCEGVPTAMLEAMAASRPVVMTDVGHIGTIVRDGVEGFLVPPGDIVALGDRLLALLANPALAHDMGICARHRAQAHDVRAIARRLRAVLVAATASGGLKASRYDAEARSDGRTGTDRRRGRASALPRKGAA